MIKDKFDTNLGLGDSIDMIVLVSVPLILSDNVIIYCKERPCCSIFYTKGAGYIVNIDIFFIVSPLFIVTKITGKYLHHTLYV